MTIIDAHTHGPGEGVIHGKMTAEMFLKMMDENGIDIAVTHPILWGAPGVPAWDSYVKANEHIADAIRRYPKRIVGFIRINPHYKEQALKYIENGISQKGFSGLKLHPRNEAYPVNSVELVHPLMELASKHKIPVLTHSGADSFCTPIGVGELAECFPEVTIIMGHMGGRAMVEDAIYIAGKLDNIILETSFDHSLATLKRAIDKVGVERVVFGSDMGGTGLPHSPRLEISRFDYLGLSPEQKTLVLGKNIARILEIEKRIFLR